jgi:hypothetical protein
VDVSVREVLVVHDGACGACAGVAGDLPGLLRVPVRVRSCRDPELVTAFPGLPQATRACRAPAIGTVRTTGHVRWRTGLRAAPALLGLLRPRALPRAAVVLVTAARRTWRTRGEQH